MQDYRKLQEVFRNHNSLLVKFVSITKIQHVMVVFINHSLNWMGVIRTQFVLIQFKIDYFLSWLITGWSQLVGLGAEMQKTSILMGLLKYNEYEATNITYFISIGSSSLYFLFLLFYFKLAHQIDFLAIQLLFPLIVIFTDVGNYVNRLFYDQAIVFTTLIVELIQIALLLREYFRKKEQEKEEKKNRQWISEAFGTQHINQTCHSQSLIRIYQGERKQTIKDLQYVLYIIAGQLALGGNNKTGILVEKYNNQMYWYVTGFVYLIGFGIAFILYKIQAKHYEKMKKEADINFYDFRNMKESFLLALLGMISFFCSGIAGVGAGIILIPCCIIFQAFKMSIKRAISTMVLIQFLIDLCVFLQRFQNYNSVKIVDLVYYLFLGASASFFITLTCHSQLIDKEKQPFHLIIIIILLFLADFCVGIYQAITFKSPNQDGSYFSISIDDCSQNCKYKSYKQ